MECVCGVMNLRRSKEVGEKILIIEQGYGVGVSCQCTYVCTYIGNLAGQSHHHHCHYVCTYYT